MQKRGQIFIVGAIVLCLAIFVLVAKVNKIERKIIVKEFPYLAENYYRESVKVVNQAILQGEDPEKALSNFTEDFVEYAKTIDPNLGLVYVYYNGSEAVVFNYNPKENAKIYPQEGGVQAGESTFPWEEQTNNSLTLKIGGFSYKTTVPVKLRYFGKYNTAEVSAENLFLEIGGIVYPIDLEGQEDFEVIIRSKGEEEVETKFYKRAIK